MAILVAIMHVSRIKNRHGKKVYEQVLLRESYREPGAPRSRVKHRTLLNLTAFPEKDVQAIEWALKHKGDLQALQNLSNQTLLLQQDRSVGAVWLLWSLAQRIGLVSALGSSLPARRVLWQVFARVLEQGSRLSAVRLAKEHAACEVLGLDDFDEDDLYDSLDWIDARQAQVEQRLYRRKDKDAAPQLFLYDVTSAYLEGQCNEYGAYGYNRDGKKGKQQIVVGLLCDARGDPVATEVFAGNTQDPQTFYAQVRKAGERFGCERVTFVGDRGMIKSAQIADLAEVGFHYITAITKPQIETLLKRGVIQLELFDEGLCEVTHEGVRYVLRRNPYRAAEMDATRKDKQRSIEDWIQKQNTYLAHHPRARVSKALQRVQERIEKLCVEAWLRVKADGRILRLEVDGEVLADVSRLDGCYVIRTDLPVEAADKEIIHDRYKDLGQVESAFRTCKTAHLEIRPVYVRTAPHTRAHVFIVMLAYRLRRELDAAWRHLDLTVEEGLRLLGGLCATEVRLGDEAGYLTVPAPRDTLAELFAACDVQPPTALPRRKAKVATKRKLPSRRRAR